jgi:hypothetical protein
MSQTTTTSRRPSKRKRGEAPLGESIRGHIRSNVIGYVALFVALSGTAYAVDGPLAGVNQVGSEDIIDAEVKTQDVANNAIGSGKIPDGAVRSADVADDTTGFALTGTDIADDALTGADIAGKSILTDDIGFATITGANISDGSITGADLATNAVGTSEIAAGVVGQSEIQTDGVAGAEIVNSSIRSADLNTNAVGGADLATIITREETVTAPGDGSSFNVTAECNPGERLLSGGADWTPARHDTHLIESRRATLTPTNPGNAWRVIGAIGTVGPGFSEDPSDLTAEAYCLPAGT